jgi:hypothetical protein
MQARKRRLFLTRARKELIGIPSKVRGCAGLVKRVLQAAVCQVLSRGGKPARRKRRAGGLAERPVQFMLGDIFERTFFLSSTAFR